MDFSSSNVPISRETWAPRSPVRGDGDRDEAGHAPRDSSYGGSGNGAPAYDRYAERPPPPQSHDVDMRDRDAPPPRRDDRDRDDRGGRNGYGGGGGGGYDRREPGAPVGQINRPPTAPRAEPNQVLGVFGLSIRTRERDLEDEFARFGDVEKVIIVYDQRTDRSRGFGFITMRTVEDAERAIAKLNGVMLHGRAIRVDFSATQKAHAPTPGEYRGEKRPLDDRFGGPPPRRFDDRRGGYDRYERPERRDYDDRRGGGGYDRDRSYGGPQDRDSHYGGGPPPRREDDPYGGRSRRDDSDRRRSPSPPPRRRYSASPDRRGPPPAAPQADRSEAPRY